MILATQIILRIVKSRVTVRGWAAEQKSDFQHWPKPIHFPRCNCFDFRIGCIMLMLKLGILFHVLMNCPFCCVLHQLLILSCLYFLTIACVWSCVVCSVSSLTLTERIHFSFSCASNSNYVIQFSACLVFQFLFSFRFWVWCISELSAMTAERIGAHMTCPCWNSSLSHRKFLALLFAVNVSTNISWSWCLAFRIVWI